MSIFGDAGLKSLVDGLSSASVLQSVNHVFDTYSVVLTGAIMLTLTVYFIRKILNGANKGKARLR